MKMKRKGIILASAILGSVAVVSTGFAAWVISTPKTTEATGNIQVETVTDDRTSFTVAFADGNDDVYFGAPATMSNPDAWLTNQGGTQEDRDASLDVDVKYQGANASGNITVTLQFGTMSEGENPTFQNGTKAVVDGNKNALSDTGVATESLTYFEVPTGWTLADDGASYSKTFALTDGHADVDLEFGWGTAFASVNPYDYYNGKTYNDTLGNAAVANLTALNTLINNKIIKFSIKFEPAA